MPTPDALGATERSSRRSRALPATLSRRVLSRRAVSAAAGIAAVAGLAVALALLPAVAQAAEPSAHTQLFSYFASAFKEGKGGSHPPYPPTFEGFEDACGLAADSAGDIYVSDYYHDVIDVFRPEGSSLGYVTQIAAEEPVDGPCGLAVDPAGDVYVNNWRQNVVKFTPSEFPPQPSNNTFPPKAATSYSGTVIDPGRATGVTTDSHGNVFVDERTAVAEYGSSGSLVKRFGEGDLGSSPGSGYGVAVSNFAGSEGDVYVADAAAHLIRVYGPGGEPLAPIDGAGTPQAGFNSLLDSSLAVDPSDGHLFVVDNLLAPFEHPLAVIDEFNPSGAYRGQISSAENNNGTLHALTDAEPTGLALDAFGNVYVTAGNTEEAALFAFGPTVPAHGLEVTKSGTGEGTVTSKPAGIACGSACSAEYNEGEAVTLTATPSPTSTFVGFSGSSCNGTGACHLTLDADAKVNAEFKAIPQQPLTLAKSGTGVGAVTSTPAGIDCGASCTAEFNQGATLTLTATPQTGSAFAAWAVNGNAATCPGTGSCQLTLNAATEVKAEFTPLPPQPLALGAPAGALDLPRPSIANRSALTLGKPSVAASTATLGVTVPTAGTLSASGPGLSPTAQSVGAGRATLHLHLNRRGKRALQRAKRRRLELKVEVAFTPSDGSPPSALTKTLTFKQPSREKR